MERVCASYRCRHFRSSTDPRLQPPVGIDFVINNTTSSYKSRQLWTETVRSLRTKQAELCTPVRRKPGRALAANEALPPSHLDCIIPLHAMPRTSMLLALSLPATSALMAGTCSIRCALPAAASRAACFLNAAPEDGSSGSGRFEGQIAQFAPPQTLLQVRGQRAKVQQQLADAIADEDYTTAALLRDDLHELKQKDPAVMAAVLREELSEHVANERYDEAARCRDELLILRRFLPQYQLAGLWKGNYPNHGDEMVRLHYNGDQLYATKITGDEHVPAGEVTFRADLAAPADSLSEDLGSSSRSYGGASTVRCTPSTAPSSPEKSLHPPTHTKGIRDSASRDSTSLSSLRSSAIRSARSSFCHLDCNPLFAHRLTFLVLSTAPTALPGRHGCARRGARAFARWWARAARG